VITKDIDTYVWRANLMLDGRIPYLDFYGGSKPPLYNYMLYGMGLVLSPGPVQFRGFFSFIDAFVALLLFRAGVIIKSEEWGFRLGLIYALNPLNMITIGLSGHYEPVILIFLVSAFIFYFNKKYALSSLSLGVAFALKIFPVVIVPFILYSLKTWKDRIQYTVLFAIPMAISLIPLLIISPEAITSYLNEESTWKGALSFSYLIEGTLNSGSILVLKITWIMVNSFLAVIFIMFLTVIFRKDKYQNTIVWYKIILLLMLISYGTTFPMAFIYYEVDVIGSNIMLWIVIPFIIFAGISYILLQTFLPAMIPEKLDKTDQLLAISAFAIMLFLFGLPNFAPWYLLWYLPLILMIKAPKIRLTIFWLMFWHHTGVGVSLLPGLFLVN
jgi:hypothetical protein